MSPKRLSRISALLAVVALAVAVALRGLPELVQFQRASSLAAFAVAAALGGASALYLLRRSERVANAASALAGIGFVSATLALIATCGRFRMETGSWWGWEESSSILLIVWLCHIAYFLIRSSTDASERSSRFGAVFATAAAVDAPFLYFSVRWFLAGRSDGEAPASELMIDPGVILLFGGVCLSFLAMLFYLYDVERTRQLEVRFATSSTTNG